MSTQAGLFPEHELVYIKGWGVLEAKEIMIKGAILFSSEQWKNGFNLVLDYTEVTKIDITTEDVHSLARQDRDNAARLNKSKCAIVVSNDLLFGLSRMWEILSEQNFLATEVFKELASVAQWLGISPQVLSECRSNLP